MRPLVLGKYRVAEARGSDELLGEIAATTGLTPRAIRNRLTRAHASKLLRTTFTDFWPSRLDELGAEPAADLVQNAPLLAEFARLLSMDATSLRNKLLSMPECRAREASEGALPSSLEKADVLTMTVQQLRGRGELARFAAVLDVDAAILERRIRRVHGAVRVENAIVDLLATATPKDPKLFLGRFRLIGKKWRGGFGIVREALDCAFEPHRKVVLKWAHAGASATKSLRGEYERARDLRHEGLVGYFELERDGRTPVLVIEHGGRSLKEVLESKRMSVPEAIALCRHLAAALDYLGEEGIAHNDVHPGNILVGDDGRVRLTDFGIARRLSGARGETIATSEVPGHYPRFAAPEVESGRASRTSDQYSIALVFLACVCGIDGALDCIDNDVGFPGSLSAQQLDAFRRARSESSRRRFESCSKFVEALDAQRGPASGDSI